MRGLPWSDLKVAFTPGDNIDRLWAASEDGRMALPEGWSLCETDGAGARMVAIFRVETLPTVEDAYKVKAELRRWSR